MSSKYWFSFVICIKQTLDSGRCAHKIEINFGWWFIISEICLINGKFVQDEVHVHCYCTQHVQQRRIFFCGWDLNGNQLKFNSNGSIPVTIHKNHKIKEFSMIVILHQQQCGFSFNQLEFLFNQFHPLVQSISYFTFLSNIH